MNRNKFINRSSLIVFLASTIFTSFAAAQRTEPTPVKVITSAAQPLTVASRNNLYCAGYVQSSPIKTENQIVGGLEEQEKYNFAQNDVVYVNMGANKGVNVGDVLAVVRPRGQVKTRWTRKDDLGFLVQEVGALEVVRVKNDVSIARVKTSCDSFLLGDLVQPVPERMSPMHQGRAPLDRFIEPSDKATGRLFMARYGAEMLSRDQIVYIDLGAEDNVRVGDYLTIFRPLGRGNLFDRSLAESINSNDVDFQSRVYRGGKFSNQAPRKSGDRARGSIVKTEDAKDDRSQIRKVVGEMVVLNVKERTATAVITRTAQEIHTGDWVQLQ